MPPQRPCRRVDYGCSSWSVPQEKRTQIVLLYWMGSKDVDKRKEQRGRGVKIHRVSGGDIWKRTQETLGAWGGLVECKEEVIVLFGFQM